MPLELDAHAGVEKRFVLLMLFLVVFTKLSSHATKSILAVVLVLTAVLSHSTH